MPNVRTIWKRRASNAVAILGIAIGTTGALSIYEIDPLRVLGIEKILSAWTQQYPVDITWQYQAVSQLINFLIGIGIGIGFVAYLSVPLSLSPKLENDALHSTSDNTPILDRIFGEDSIPPNVFAVVASRLNRRINELRSRSTQIYWTIILTLIAGIFIIIFAGSLSTIDSTLQDLWSSVDSERRSAVEEMGRQQLQLSRARDASPSELEQLSVVSAGVVEPFKDAKERLAIANENHRVVITALIDYANNRNESSKDIYSSGTVLRIGVVALLIFLTQILISLYRYNSRLVAFYCSRRDALTLVSDGDPTHLRQFASLLLPSSLDFGREPKHPFQEIGRVIQSAAARTKKQVFPQVSGQPVAKSVNT